ncbi:unnamed protein product [Lactuca virosa]|uniref:DDX21/DDX50 dimerisation domain-containing protein n=1 Tax=Lactuca virosa TaxID=75947 RepID=A0AAU9LJN6_9ASTR|nr:unnamed protein product [Lactuca virosa]
MGAPNSSETAYGASRVELYRFLKQRRVVVGSGPISSHSIADHLAMKFVCHDRENVRHIIMPCSWSTRSQLIPDIIRHHSSEGRTIVFTKLSGVMEGARPLHGHIQQSGHECEPPRDVEDYIHRSGRTGKSNISKLEREAGVKFEHISAPQPADIAKAVGGDAAEAIIQVADSVIPVFKSAAEELLNNFGLTPVELLAKALAKSIAARDAGALKEAKDKQEK